MDFFRPKVFGMFGNLEKMMMGCSKLEKKQCDVDVDGFFNGCIVVHKHIYIYV